MFVKRKKRIKRINKKITYTTIVIIIIFFYALLYTNNIIKQNKLQEIKAKNIYQDILKHYNKYEKTNKETNIYILENNSYKKAGKINKNVELTIKEEKISQNNKYFEITSLDDTYYIYYNDVDPIEKPSEKDERYKKYIVFNENVITNKVTKLYKDDNYAIEINQSFSFPIIIKELDRYYIEYSNQLYYVLKKDIKETEESVNSNITPKSRVRTIAYHRIYDPNTEICDQIICHTEEQFESHIKYLAENNYLTLTTKELELFIDGKLQIPTNSVVITIDDGTMDKRAIPILEKYKINATLFLVTSRFKEQDYIDFTSDYLELHSHSHNMHWAGECPGYGYQGGGILCLSDEKILEDLRQSREILDNSTVFCYPFYDYDDRAIDLLKKAGFTMAFAGELKTNGYSYVGTNKMKIPRVTLSAYTTFEEFKMYVS